MERKSRERRTNMNVAYAPEMQTLPPMEVIVLPATKSTIQEKQRKKKIVAAYCRVSTDQEEQLTSYEAQIEYYTNKIESNPEWKLVDIFADEGITGTSAKKRKNFMRMIEMCREGKIDRILTKSISRFARNVVDSINFTRELKSYGVSVYFEKENIDTEQMTSETILSLHSVLAQAESESLSNNVRLGKRMGYKNGRAAMQYGNLLGYRKGADGNAEIVPEEAEIITLIFTKFLEGNSYAEIAKELKNRGYKTTRGKDDWSLSVIQGILKNEKYKGDVLLQKTFIVDIFNKKSQKNTGELPMYLYKNHHIPIINPAVFDKVQVEIARRNSMKSTSDKNATENSRFSSKYALTGLVECGECGGKYRRTTWSKRGKKKVVWRCISRLEHGTKYCKDSPTIEEERIHLAIVRVLNNLLDNTEKLRSILTGSIAELLSAPNTEMQIIGLSNSIKVKNDEIIQLIAQCVENRESRTEIDRKCKEKHDEVRNLQEKLNSARAKQQIENAHSGEIREIFDMISQMPFKYEEYDDDVARKLVSRVRIMSEEKVEITLMNTVTLTTSL